MYVQSHTDLLIFLRLSANKTLYFIYNFGPGLFKVIYPKEEQVGARYSGSNARCGLHRAAL